jgi:hypothetical protein
MKIQQKVLKKIPNAKLYSTTNGYFIGYESDEGIVNLLADQLLPNQESKEKAWECALLSVKTSQNFNRTHPLRVDMYSELDKQERIEKRKNKGKINKEKLNDHNIYF